jgi:predicted RND superfamily exporter protein
MKTKHILFKYRWLIIALFLGITVLLGLQLPKAEIDPEVMNLLPEDMPSRIQTDSIESVFGGTDLLVVILKADDVLKPETLKRLKTLSKKANRLSSVDDVMSLFDLKSIKGENGMMIVDPAVKKIPETREGRETIRKEIRANDLVYKVVVSEDFSLTSLILTKTPEATDVELIGEVKQMLEENPGDEEVYMAGLPYVRYNEEKDIRKDMMSLMPLGLLIMLVFLFFSFKEVKGVILPFSIVVISIIVALGSIPALNWKIMMPTIILPIMLIAIANDYGIHLIARYQELNRLDSNLSKKDIAKSYNNIGSIYLANNQLYNALEFYFTSLKIRETINDILGIAQSQNNIALVYKKLDRYQEALEYFSQSLSNYNKIG